MAHPRERPASYGWMKRRDFLRSSAAAVSAVGLLASCGADNKSSGSLVKWRLRIIPRRFRSPTTTRRLTRTWSPKRAL